MKLKNLSRLTALLLALMMLLSSVAAAEIYGLDYTSSDFDQLVHAVQREKEAYCEDPLCTYGWTAINEYAIEDRYGYFMGLGLSADELDKMLLHLINHSGSFPEEMCLNCYIQDRTLYPYGSNRHQEGCPWYGNDPILTVNGVTVTGNIPSDVTLLASVVPVGDIKTLIPNEKMEDGTEYHPFDGIENRPHVAYDISLKSRQGTYKPEEPVTVTIKAEELQLNPGDQFLVYHVHSDDNENWDWEVLPVGTATEENTAVFTMGRFSYVIVFNSSLSINVEAFYPLDKYKANKELAWSGNGNWVILGIYFDVDDNTHVLLGNTKKVKESDVISFFVNGIPYSADGDNESLIWKSINSESGTISEITIQSGTATETIIDFDPDNLNGEPNGFSGSLSGYFDINIGKATVSESFTLALDSSSAGVGTPTNNGWDIVSTPITLDLDYNVEKTVDIKETVGDNSSIIIDKNNDKTIYYKLVVTNELSSDRNLTCEITDVLPSGVFDLGSVFVQTPDSTEWKQVTGVEDGQRFKVGNVAGLAPGNSTTFYVKATLKAPSNLESGEYINTAYLNGTALVEHEDTASFVVPKGTIVLRKKLGELTQGELTSFDTFTFQVTGQTDVVLGKNGLDKTFMNLANGAYTIIEKKPKDKIGGYNLKSITVIVDGEVKVYKDIEDLTNEASVSVTVVVDDEHVPEVEFINNYVSSDRRLEIKKDFAGIDSSAMAGKTFVFEVSDPGNPEWETKYVYLNSGNNWSSELRGVEPDHPYKITELGVQGEGADYIELENTAPDNYAYKSTAFSIDKVTLVSNASATCTVEVNEEGKTTVVCTNTYEALNSTLTIIKEGSTVDPNDSFIFTVTGEDVNMKVVIKGTGSVTIADLPLGTYTVTEDLAWSWRYTQQSVTGLNDGEVEVDADGATVVFTNAKDNDQWLSDESSIVNFDGTNQ